MHKTFKKSIACLLAMLMILTTMPFTAFATTANRDWWVADGIDPSTIKEEPEYWGYNSDERYNQEFGSWALAFGEVIDLSDGSGKEDHRDHYKPIMAVTTSLIGHNGDAVKDLKTASTSYYGASAAKTYDVVDAAGNILNPTQLKAGQRIAVSIEFGGFDTFQVGQLKGYYDNTKLKTAYYKGTPSRADTWTATPEDSSVAWIKTGAAYYGEQLQFAGANSVTDVGNNRGSFYLAITAVHAVNGNDTQSAFLGTGANDPDGARPFGKYGIYCGTLSFEVLQDCSLKDAFWFETRDMANYIEGTTLRAYAANTISDGLTEIAFGNNKDTFAHPWLIWSKDESASAECTHANTQVQNAVDPTCTTEGYTGDTVCKDCGATVSAGTKIPATGHSLTETAAKGATCTEAGNSAYWTCSVCGKMFSDATGTTEITEVPTISATGHSLSEVKEVPSTCTVKGTAAYWTCSACGKMFSDAEGTTEISAPVELPLAKHSYSMVKTEATCTEPSSEVYTCVVCHDTYTTHVDPAKGHTEVSANNAVAATCTTDGKESDTKCSVCGIKLTTGAVIPATGHSLSKVNEVPSTCTVKGTAAYWTCTACDKMFSDAAGTTEISAPTELPLAAHDYEITASTAGDCQTKGSTTYTCKNCPDTYTDENAYGPHGEAVSANNAVAATCTTDGKESDMVCPICNAVLTEGATIKATGHKEVSANNGYDATCTEDGKESDTKCSVCGVTLTTGATIPAPGHTPGEPVETIIKEATCTEKGEKNTTVKCTVCDTILSSVNEELAETGHTPVSANNAVASTCTVAGKESDTICSVCKETLTTGAARPLAPHTPVSANNAVDATLDAPGKEADTICDVCKTVLETGATIPALKGYTVTVDAVDLGAVTIDGADATNGTSKKVLANSTVTLEATPVEGADFEGWYVGTKKVADGTTYEATIVADVTITPVFTTTTKDEFTVIFMDNFGNIIDTQKVASGADIVEPTAPVRMGYTFEGWSMTEAEIDALTSAATIKANYVKDVVTTYTVTATGCVITVNGVDYNDVATGITYNTKVTVTKEGTDVWTIDGAEAAYGDTYTFYVGSNIEVVPVTNPSAVPMATVVNVSKTAVAGTTKYTYLATRSVPAGYTVVSSGFIYGKGVDTDPAKMILDNVGNGYSATYTKTTSAQFSITVGTKSTGTYIAVRAFVVCKDNKGNILAPVYADVVSTNY